MSGDIDKLAESGKEIRDRDKIRQERADQKKKIREARQARRNTSRLYFMLAPRQFVLVLYLAMQFMGFLFLASEVYGFNLSSKGSKFYYPDRDDYGIPHFIIVTSLGILGLIFFKLIMPALSQKTFEKEKRFLNSLPFKTEDYFETIGKNIGHVNMYIDWKKAPEKGYVEDIIQGLSLGRSSRYGKFTGNDSELCIDLGSSSHKNGYKALKHYHTLCKKVFVPLHEKYGIHKIRFA